MNPENTVPPAQKLKMATAHSHSQIEGGFPVMREDFDLEKYQNLLGKLYGFYLPLETVFSDTAVVRDWISDYGDRQKLNFLEMDLAYFKVPSHEISNLSKKQLWFDQPTKARVLGTLYVLEGSTLGGQIISKHLKNKFQFPDANGTRFFSAYGGQTGPMWKRFQSLLNEHLNESALLEESILAANATFEHLAQWLKQP